MKPIRILVPALMLCHGMAPGQGVLETYKRLTEEDRNAIRKEKIATFVQPEMRREGVDMWITLTREYVQDPIAADLGAGRPTARAALVFTDEGNRLGRTAIMASYDVDAPARSGIYDTIIPYRSEGLLPHLKRFLEQRSPAKVAVNTSKDTPLSDGLTASMLTYLKEAAGPQFGDDNFVSAEALITAWRGKKTRREVDVMRVAVKATEEIIAQAFSQKVIKPGRTTELDVALYVKALMRKMSVSESWEPSGCPSINTGVSRGHSEPTDAVIQPGHLLTIDFGINLDGYCTDIQRTAYVLRPHEVKPPSHIVQMWETNRKSIEAGFSRMRVGLTGNDVDAACRSVIVDAGYKEYPHAAGHPIGYSTHEIGPMLGPNWPERYGLKVFLKLEPNQIFALEPAISSPSSELGGDSRIGIEEDVLIAESGPEWLSTPQKDIILIPSQ